MGCTTQIRVCKIGLVLLESEYIRVYVSIISECHLFMKAPGGHPSRLWGRGCRRHSRSIGVGRVAQALAKADATFHEAFVTVQKRPGRLVILPAKPAGEIRTRGGPVQRLVETDYLGELRDRLLSRPRRQVDGVQPHEAIHLPGGQVPQVPLRSGGGTPYPLHLTHPLDI